MYEGKTRNDENDTRRSTDVMMIASILCPVSENM
jgi:hypothetical protein